MDVLIKPSGLYDKVKAVMAAIASIVCENPVIIKNAESVKNHIRTFFGFYFTRRKYRNESVLSCLRRMEKILK
ncbi:MAG: hypothetical protein ACYCWE_22095 [Eubacteriales bacterium]